MRVGVTGRVEVCVRFWGTLSARFCASVTGRSCFSVGVSAKVRVSSGVQGKAASYVFFI